MCDFLASIWGTIANTVLAVVLGWLLKAGYDFWRGQPIPEAERRILELLDDKPLPVGYFKEYLRGYMKLSLDERISLPERLIKWGEIKRDEKHAGGPHWVITKRGRKTLRVGRRRRHLGRSGTTQQQ